jgi:hypothetical protein
LSLNENTHRPVRRFFIALAVLAALLLVALLVIRFSGTSVWDDAYFNARYADNFLQNGEFTWNPGEEPAYGLTSLLHGTLVVGLRFGLTGSPALPLILASLLGGLLAIIAIYRLISEYTDGYGQHRWSAMVFLALLLGFNANQLSVHFTSGMDTALSMAFLAVYLSVIKRFEGELSPGKALVTGMLGGLAWIVRPDLLIFTGGIPFALAIFAKKRIQRVEAGYLLIFTAFSLLTQILLISQTFSSLVPLSFHVKSTLAGFDALREAYQGDGLLMLAAFLATNWLASLAIPCAVFLNFRRWRGAFTIADKAAFLCLGGFMVYQALIVIPVMGYEQRFFYPAWPVLAYLGAKSAVHLLYQRPAIADRLFPRISGSGRLLPLLAFALVIAGLAAAQKPWQRPGPVGQFDMVAVYRQIGKANWPYLERFSILPNKMSMAATELGILSALNPDRVIYDLSGLNDRELAIEGFSDTRLVHDQQPDLIFLPHPDYQDLRKKITESPAFNEQYETVSGEAMGTFLDLALRKDSPYYSQMRFIVDDERKKMR